jgi:transposase-like protein
MIIFEKNESMVLLDFHQRFPDEESCIEYLHMLRINEGLVCKKCKSADFYWKKDRLMFECKQCKSRLSIRKGTIFENSKVTLLLWFKTIHLVSSTKKTFSASEIQRQLGYENYETIWGLLHKLRWAMGERDKKYQLDSYLEIDEGFFKVVDKEIMKDQLSLNQKRGRGSINHLKVLVAIESSPAEVIDERYKHKPKRKCGHLKMIVMDDLKAETINTTIKATVQSGSNVITDKYKGYTKLKEIMNHQEINTSEMKEVHKAFPWVHSAIGNSKKILLGFHHSIGKDYLQSYLNEFCYKFNRRYILELFDRVLIACIVEYRKP